MRKIILSVFTVALLSSCGGSQSSSEVSNTQSTFKVYGNCGMCKKTIEGSLTGIEGILKADWNKKTKQIDIEFDEAKIKLDEIKQKIAGVGYDMENVRAEESVYSNLAGCCQYNRPGSEGSQEQMLERPIDSANHNEDHSHQNH